jgi:RNA-directed DNA polymerase
MREVDAEIDAVAKEHGLLFTRYSDDMTFSTKNSYSRAEAVVLISDVAQILKSKGLFLNRKKTVIVPPGARKIVLGLLVDRDTPNLPREFKDRMRQHLYYLKNHGIQQHIARREFDSVGGAYRHLLGLINYANMVDSEYAEKLRTEFDSLPWPGVS